MKVDVVNTRGEKVSTVELPPEIFEAPIKTDLMHQALTRQLANARLGTHKTKTRGEVSGGGRKPWRQKGTGRARQGSTRAAQWVGGGKVHTPRPRDYAVEMPRKMRRAALRSALSEKAAASAIVILDELKLQEPKTREMAAILRALVGQASALILLPEADEPVERSVRNLPEAKTLRASYLNIRDLLGFDRIILPLGALQTISVHLGQAGGAG
ncbi:MAG TPA: 50S ribosomal protein L4 [Anaerolineales bacterium]|uniref:Large ribosomal subunit protein uL4 n=2 Tax=environmental samples TaxID=58229 RepID=A0A0H4TBJ7_9CHLR|nr:50S ribosomal protein L4, large subunit ribosomal protein L4 [uncultured Chloroflexi bacterium Rifle_16ft_4_minimus_450]AKQ05144.1 50S ribosomal protein L4, large subunit ribosomal protein L4 [uncultured Chloroflexi bacterium Rifle_16ft_4_minimus_26684]HLB63545.1 50S ribosomal protein L4 [Anaerolineales bacterium]